MLIRVRTQGVSGVRTTSVPAHVNAAPFWANVSWPSIRPFPTTVDQAKSEALNAAVEACEASGGTFAEGAAPSVAQAVSSSKALTAGSV